MSPNLYGMSRFEGKTALVTGGASGIGRATTNRLAAEGAQVIIADSNVDMANKAVSEIEADGGDVVYVEVDLADDAAVEAVGRAVAEQFPALHILVNNAAILRQGRIEDGGLVGKLGAGDSNRFKRLGPDDSGATADVKEGGRCYRQSLLRGRFSRQTGTMGLRCNKSGLGFSHQDDGL